MGLALQSNILWTHLKFPTVSSSDRTRPVMSKMSEGSVETNMEVLCGDTCSFNGTFHFYG